MPFPSVDNWVCKKNFGLENGHKWSVFELLQYFETTQPTWFPRYVVNYPIFIFHLRLMKFLFYFTPSVFHFIYFMDMQNIIPWVR